MTALRPTRMRTLATWGALGEAAYVLGQFIVLIGLARFAGVESVGAFGLANAIVWPIIASLSLGLRVNLATDIAGRLSFRDVLQLRLICCALAAIATFGIALLALSGVAQLILMIYGSAKIVEMVSEICFGMFQRAGRMDLVFRSLALRSLGVAAPVFAALALGAPAPLALLVHVAVWSLVALLLDLPAAYRLAATLNALSPASRTGMTALFRMSLPLWLTGTLAAVQGNVPRYAVGAVLGLGALGHFTVVAYVMQAVFSLFFSVADAVVSRLATYAERGDTHAFVRALSRLVGIVGAFAVVTLPLAWGFGDEAIVLAFGPDYTDLGVLLTLLLVAALLNACLTIVQAALEANRAFAAIAVSRTVFLVVLTIATVVAARWHGLTGVAWAMCLVHLAQAVFQTVVLTRQPLFRRPAATE